MRERIRKLLIGLYCLLFVAACDPDHKKKCEWYLVPDTDRAGKSDPGFIPVCARNYVANKQDCRLQTKLSFAKKVYNMTFRYTDLKVQDFGLPRTIDSITFCSK